MLDDVDMMMITAIKKKAGSTLHDHKGDSLPTVSVLCLLYEISPFLVLLV